MKGYFYRILSSIAILIFLLYWTGVIVSTLPSKYIRNIITDKVPRFKTVSGFGWRLFTPPHTYNHRLYFIVRDIKAPQKSDTVEVLENITRQKQQKVPFNQKERAMDYLVQINVTEMLRRVWGFKQMPGEDIPGTTDSSYIAKAVVDQVSSSVYRDCLATLHNYCKVVLNEQKMDIRGKEVKIIVTRKPIRPYKERNNKQFIQKETPVFETAYQQLRNDAATN
ncbi:MAG: hypothetical protein ABIN67_12800 [Ferruginibacter sp.]